jgi:hypothetical protein
MSAWLLWVVKHPSPLWQQYRRVLPAPQDVSCLLTFGPDDIPELQLPSLQVGAAAAHVVAWPCAHGIRNKATWYSQNMLALVLMGGFYSSRGFVVQAHVTSI